MDFSPEPAQRAVADVVTSVMDRNAESGDLWSALAASGVTTLALPERLGGDGLGISEVATVLTELGRHGAVTPALATLGLSVVPLLQFATDQQQDTYFSRVAGGGVLTAALNEPGTALPDRPSTTFVGNRLTGTKVGVPYAARADWMIVTADNADVVKVEPTPASNNSDEYVVTFSDVAVPDSDVLAGVDAHKINRLALAMVGAYGSGLVAGALRLTADYVANRHQL